MLKTLLENIGYIEKNRESYLNVLVNIPKCAGGTMAHHVERKYGKEKTLDPDSIDKNSLARLLSENEAKFAFSKWEKNVWYMKRAWLTEYINSLEKSHLDEIRCIHGHLAYFGIHDHFSEQPRYFVFIREPLARFVSYYNYTSTVRVTPQRLLENEIVREDGTIRTLDEWLEEANLNHYSMSAYLSQICNKESFLENDHIPSRMDIDAVKRMLVSFYFVGLTENRDDMEFVYNRLGITNYVPDTHVLGKKKDYARPRNSKAATKIVSARCPFDQELYEFAIQLNRRMKGQIETYDRAVAYTRFRRGISKSFVDFPLRIFNLYKNVIQRNSKL